MAHAFAKADAQLGQSTGQAPAYSVYIYHRPENQHEGQNDWEMRTVTRDLNAAMDEAKSLYQSQSYRKVEVKQRILDPKTERTRDHTLKVFAPDAQTLNLETWFASFGVFLMAGGVIWILSGLF